jgi:hypothetical protein
MIALSAASRAGTRASGGAPLALAARLSSPRVCTATATRQIFSPSGFFVPSFHGCFALGRDGSLERGCLRGAARRYREDVLARFERRRGHVATAHQRRERLHGITRSSVNAKFTRELSLGRWFVDWDGAVAGAKSVVSEPREAFVRDGDASRVCLDRTVATLALRGGVVALVGVQAGC